MLLTVKEYAKKVKLDEQTIYRLIRENKISHIKIGGSIRIETKNDKED